MFSYISAIIDFLKGFIVNKDSSVVSPPIPIVPVNKNQLSKSFTFNDLTTTSHIDMLEANRAEGRDYTPKLTRVATELLQPIVDGFNPSLTVHSGYRGKTLNAKVGGALTSQHCLGEAADFNITGYETRAKQIEVLKWIRDESGIKFGQLLLENGCIHISLGTKMEIAEYDVPTKTKKPIRELAL